MNALVAWLRAQLDECEREAPELGTHAMEQWILADVVAKRAILDEAEAVCEEVRSPSGAEHYVNARARQFAYEQVIKLLAQPFAGQDGWREAWRV